jgi:hypothetical protein
MVIDSTLAAFDEEVGGECPPDLYRAQQAAGGVNGFAAVDDQQIALFHQQGYLVVHNAFTGAEVAGALAGLLDLIGGTYPAYRGVQYEKTRASWSRRCRMSRSRIRFGSCLRWWNMRIA